MRHGHYRRNFGLALALCVVCVLAGSIARAADDPLRAALQLRYAAMKAAMAAHDGSGIAAILAPNFVSIDVTGQFETASQMIAEVNALKPDPNKSSETTLIFVVPEAKAATVKQRYDMKTVGTAADGSQHHFELVTLSTDTWIKPANAWLMERTVTNDVSMFTDGKLVTHKP